MSHYTQFVVKSKEIAATIVEEDFRDQEKLLNDLFAVEKRFVETLLSHPEGKEVAESFVKHIVSGNILSARVYFRERQDTFNKEMISLFRTLDWESIMKYRINYPFMKWVISRYSGPQKDALSDLVSSAVMLRHTLMHKDVFLAFSRAKIFWSKTPTSHLEYMDLVQDACEGYLNAVDKFTPPYTTTFRAVVIGRITLKILTDYNAPMLQFSPVDHRTIYRANNARYKEGLSDMGDILKYVQESYPKVTKEKLEVLEAAMRVTSALVPTPDGKSVKELPDRTLPTDHLTETNEILAIYHETLNAMPPLFRKAFLLKRGLIEYE